LDISLSPHEYDFSQAFTANRLDGLWRMLSGFRWRYIIATVSLAIAALAKTATFLLLRYFIDSVLGQGDYSLGGNLNRTLILIALGFLGLAVIEGSFSYLSGRQASYTAEGVTRRLRNYLFDHIQRLDFSYHDKTPTGELIERCTSDVDALRRFFSEQAIGVGRIVMLFLINLLPFLFNVKLARFHHRAGYHPDLYGFKRVTKARSIPEQEAILNIARKPGRCTCSQSICQTGL
jgi:ATP-binding cassette subfamily B protein